MAYWLLKSEPDAYAWSELVKAGPKGTAWTGIRNHTAKLNMMKMRQGDRGFFYHSNVGKEIVGICEVIRTAYPDPTAQPGEPWVCVDVKAIEPVPKPVTLAAIKAGYSAIMFAEPLELTDARKWGYFVQDCRDAT